MNAQKIKLNLIPGGIIPVIYVSQYDAGRPLQFEIYDGQSAATIESGTTIKIRGTKADGHGVEYACTYSGNVVSASTTQQMTAAPGSMTCELRLTKNSAVIGTANFILEVEESALRDGTDLSGSELPFLEDLGRTYATQAAASATAAATSATNAANSATAAAASATAAAASAATAETRVNNAVSNARTMLNNAVADATASANSSAAQARASANNSRASAEAAEQAAENGRAWAKSWAVYSSNTSEYGTDYSCSQYWADRSHIWFDKSMALYGAMQSRIDTVTALLHLLLGSIYLDTQSGDRLVTQNGDNLVMSFGEKLYLTTENNKHILTQVGNTISVTR